ncbi:MAG TPA: response regulator transcription factor [Candidatus Dojkabacteria bacterium]|nr:response regulator transcription factor [Candidatus Dojkabacteria bacterium]
MLSQKFRPSILLIICDANIGCLFQKNLLNTEFYVSIAYNAETGIKKALSNKYDIVLIDLQEQPKECFNILICIRNVNRSIPIIILGEKEDIENQINTYKLGGDLFHSKPISFPLIEAEIRQLLFYRLKNVLVQMGDIEMDLTSRIIKRKGREIRFTRSEFNLLLLLIKNRNMAISREKIISDVLNYNKDIEYAAVDTMVSRVRKKLSQYGDESVIDTVVKVGYRLNPVYIKNCKIKHY